MHVRPNKATNDVPPSQKTARLRLLPESTLLERARSKDADAFEELVDRTEVQLYRVAMTLVRNQSDAQEALQESYLSAWRSLPRFEGRSKFSSWMHRIVVNHSLMHLRARGRHPEVAIHDVDEAELGEAIAQTPMASTARQQRHDRPDQRLQSAELVQQIQMAVSCLPEKLKQTFLLREVWDASTRAIAAKMGVSELAAKTRLHRARREIRRSLGEYIAC
jgi:RNA polymerase sigma-70 factor (ECF subfamily)